MAPSEEKDAELEVSVKLIIKSCRRVVRWRTLWCMIGNDVVPLSLQTPLVVLLSHEPLP